MKSANYNKKIFFTYLIILVFATDILVKIFDNVYISILIFAIDALLFVTYLINRTRIYHARFTKEDAKRFSMIDNFTFFLALVVLYSSSILLADYQNTTYFAMYIVIVALLVPSFYRNTKLEAKRTNM